MKLLLFITYRPSLNISSPTELRKLRTEPETFALTLESGVQNSKTDVKICTLMLFEIVYYRYFTFS